MSDNISHAAHFSERELGNRPSRGVAKMRGRFADDLNSPDHGILFLLVGEKIGFGRIFDIRLNQLCAYRMSRNRPN